MEPVRDHLRSSLEWARSCLHDVLNGYPPDRVLFRASPAENHALWVVGHLALSDEWILKMLAVDGSVLPESYGKLFGYQSDVLDGADAYPSFGEVLQHMEHSRSRLLSYLGTTTDDVLREESIDDGGVNFARSPLVAIGKEAWHEGWHAGQLAVLRRKLGLAPAFG